VCDGWLITQNAGIEKWTLYVFRQAQLIYNHTKRKEIRSVEQFLYQFEILNTFHTIQWCKKCPARLSYETLSIRNSSYLEWMTIVLLNTFHYWRNCWLEILLLTIFRHSCINAAHKNIVGEYLIHLSSVGLNQHMDIYANY